MSILVLRVKGIEVRVKKRIVVGVLFFFNVRRKYVGRSGFFVFELFRFLFTVLLDFFVISWVIEVLFFSSF